MAVRQVSQRFAIGIATIVAQLLILGALIAGSAGRGLAVDSDAAAATAPESAPATPSFRAVILPILTDHCFECHSDRKQKARLRLDSRQAMLSGGKSGPAVIPGDASRSLLMVAVHYDDPDTQMPPDGPLPATQVVQLAQWIAAGAPWGDSQPAIGTQPATASAIATQAFRPAPAMDAPPPTAHRPPLIGRIHPLVVHFPICCLLLAVLAEFLYLTLGPRWDPAVRFLVYIGTCGAVVAVTTGSFFADQGTMFHRADLVLTRHEVVGWITMLLALTASGCLLMSDRPRMRLAFRLLMLMTAASAGLTGHLGGTMVYGEHFLF